MPGSDGSVVKLRPIASATSGVTLCRLSVRLDPYTEDGTKAAFPVNHSGIVVSATVLMSSGARLAIWVLQCLPSSMSSPLQATRTAKTRPGGALNTACWTVSCFGMPLCNNFWYPVLKSAKVLLICWESNRIAPARN